MTQREMDDLITGYKRDFFARTGKGLKIKIANRWESLCELPPNITTEEVFDLIFEYTGWDRSVIHSKERRRVFTEQRFLIMFILYLNGYKLMPIARLFNKKDHTTIIWGISSIQNRLDTEPFLAVFLLEIIEYIKEAKLLQKEGIRE